MSQNQPPYPHSTQQPYEPLQKQPVVVAEIVEPDNPTRNRKLLIGCLAGGGIVVLSVIVVLILAIMNLANQFGQFANQIDATDYYDYYVDDQVEDLSIKDAAEIRAAYEFDLVSPVEVNQFRDWFDDLTVEDSTQELSETKQRTLVDYEQFIQRVVDHGWIVAPAGRQDYVDDARKSSVCPEVHSRYRLVSAFRDDNLEDGFIVYAYIVQSDEINMARYWLRKDGNRWKAYDWQRIDLGAPYSVFMAMVYAEYQFDNRYSDFVDACNEVNRITEDNVLAREALEDVAAGNFDPRVRDRVKLLSAYGWTRIERAQNALESVSQAENPEGYPGFNISKGINQYALRNYDDAIASFQKVMSIVGNSAESWWYIGSCHQEMGRLDDAAIAFANAHRCDPAEFSYLRELAGATHIKYMDRLLTSIQRCENPAKSVNDLASNYYSYQQFPQLESLVQFAKQNGYSSSDYDFYQIVIDESNGKYPTSSEKVSAYENLLPRLIALRESETDENAIWEIDNTIWYCLDRVCSIADDELTLLEIYKNSQYQDAWRDHLYSLDELQPEQVAVLNYGHQQNEKDLKTTLALASNAWSLDQFESVISLCEQVDGQKDLHAEHDIERQSYEYYLVDALLQTNRVVEALQAAEDKQQTFKQITVRLLNELAKNNHVPDEQQYDLATDLIESYREYRTQESTEDPDYWISVLQLCCDVTATSDSRQQQLLELFMTNKGDEEDAINRQLFWHFLSIDNLQPLIRNQLINSSALNALNTHDIIRTFSHSNQFEPMQRLIELMNLQQLRLSRRGPTAESDKLGDLVLYWSTWLANWDKDWKMIFDELGLDKGRRLQEFRNNVEQQSDDNTSFNMYEYRQMVDRFIDAARQLGRLNEAEEIATRHLEEFNDLDFLLKVLVSKKDVQGIVELLGEHPDSFDDIQSELAYSRSGILDLPNASELRQQFPPILPQYRNSFPVILFFEQSRSDKDLEELQVRIQKANDEIGNWKPFDNDQSMVPNSRTWVFDSGDQSNSKIRFVMTLGTSLEIETLSLTSDDLRTAVENHQSWIALDFSSTLDDEQKTIAWRVIRNLTTQIIENESPSVVYFENNSAVRSPREASDLLTNEQIPEYESASPQWIQFKHELENNQESQARLEELRKQLRTVINLDSVQLQIKVGETGIAFSESRWLIVDKIQPRPWGRFEFSGTLADDSEVNPSLNKGKRFKVYDWSVIDFKLTTISGIQ